MIVVKGYQGDLFLHQAVDDRPSLEARRPIPSVDTNRPVEDVAQAQSQRALGEERSVGRYNDRHRHVFGVPQIVVTVTPSVLDHKTAHAP
jgi:hypothetical protein